MEHPKYDLTIPGWMEQDELEWLHAAAAAHSSVVEIGCWAGRSTFALLSGCRGLVTAVDHWNGSRDWPWSQAVCQTTDIFAQFHQNLSRFLNLGVIRAPSLEAARRMPPKSAEMVFIDGGHAYEELLQDIDAWLPVASRTLCGHDFDEKPGALYPGVAQAVRERFGARATNPAGLIWTVSL